MRLGSIGNRKYSNLISRKLDIWWKLSDGSCLVNILPINQHMLHGHQHCLGMTHPWFILSDFFSTSNRNINDGGFALFVFSSATEVEWPSDIRFWRVFFQQPLVSWTGTHLSETEFLELVLEGQMPQARNTLHLGLEGISANSTYRNRLSDRLTI